MVNTETLSYGRRLNDKPSDYFAFRRIDNISSIMKSPTEIHSNSAIELQVYHLITCYHNFCIMSLLSRQQSFPLPVKRICRDSSFVTLASARLSAKFSLPARFFSHCFGYHGKTLNYVCNRLRTAKRYVTWLVSNHDWKPGVISCNESNESMSHESMSQWVRSEKVKVSVETIKLSITFTYLVYYLHCCLHNFYLWREISP